MVEKRLLLGKFQAPAKQPPWAQEEARHLGCSLHTAGKTSSSKGSLACTPPQRRVTPSCQTEEATVVKHLCSLCIGQLHTVAPSTHTHKLHRTSASQERQLQGSCFKNKMFCHGQIPPVSQTLCPKNKMSLCLGQIPPVAQSFGQNTLMSSSAPR